MALADTLKAIAATMYVGTMTVTEYTWTVDASTGIRSHGESIILKDQPCRVSFDTVAQNEDGDTSRISQEITLYCDPSITIKPGSKITVTQNSVTTDYERSGLSAVYSSHQEIPLKVYEEYA